MPPWKPSTGRPETKEDDDVLQHISFYKARARMYDQQGEHEVAAKVRAKAEEYRAEAERRGLLLAGE
ncbi:hypothetical protein [Nocardia alba]|nr:hypothetical protein [Nocardia alba]